MSKSDNFPPVLPVVGGSNLRGLTLYELEVRYWKNNRNLNLLKIYLDENVPHDTFTYEYWKQFDDLRKRLKRAILLKRLKLWLLSLVGR
jgi:hypothetical protein